MGRAAAWVIAAAFATCACFEAAARPPDAAPELTAEEVVEKNVAARGGLDAWRKVETMAWIGHVESGSATGSGVSFVLEMKRPNKTRFALTAPHQRSVRTFDGKEGWKLRSTGGGPPDLAPYSSEEAAFARDGQVIDGPLIDYRAKGGSVALEAVDEIEGHKAYRIRASFPSAAIHRVWIDAQSFLEVRSERVSRTASGLPAAATRKYRDYRSVDGLQIPFVIESGAGAGKITDRMVIDKVVLNPPLADRLFDKPRLPARQRPVSVVRAAAQAAGQSGEATSPLPGRPGPSTAEGAGHAH